MSDSRRGPFHLLRTALRLNPDGGYLYFLLLGRAYLFENDIEQALINLREALRRNPDDLEGHIYLAAALVADGQSLRGRMGGRRNSRPRRRFLDAPLARDVSFDQ